MKRWIHAATEYLDNSDLGDRDYRSDIANSTTDYETMKKLSQDPDDHVRSMLALNRSLPVEIAMNLAEDDSVDVRWCLVHETQYPDVIAKLADDPDGHIRYELVFNRSVTPEILTKLADDESTIIREAVARNKKTPEDVRNKLIEDNNMDVRISARKSKSYSKFYSQIDQLIADHYDNRSSNSVEEDVLSHLEWLISEGILEESEIAIPVDWEQRAISYINKAKHKY